MKYEEIKKELEEYQEKGHGNIISADGSTYIKYHDIYSCRQMTFYDSDLCTKEHLLNIIFVGNNAKKRGVTPEYIADVLFDALGDSIVNVLMTLRGIVIINNTDDIHDYSDIYGVNYDVVAKDIGSFCSSVLDDNQTVIINEGVAFDIAKKFENTNEGFIERYSQLIGFNAIYECTKIMNRYNPIFRVYNCSDESIAQFTRGCWSRIGKNHILPIIDLAGNDWVDVEDGYPPNRQVVQVTYLSYYDKKPLCNAFAYRKNNGWYWSNDDEEVTVEVTAWRKMCEPYKGK